MNFDGSHLLAGLLASLIGFALFRYGKKQSRGPHLLIGLCLMVGPYFLPDVIWTVAYCVTLLGLLWAAGRLGY